MTLEQLSIGGTATICRVEGEPSFRRRMLQMGISPGQRVTLLGKAPFGEALRLGINRCTLAVSREAAGRIQLGQPEQSARPLRKRTYPEKKNPLARGTAVRFALAGNQNCGKTTLFNRITGGNQRVGNFPGVTVERKESRVRYTERDTVIDLPGIYSLEPNSLEERVTRNYLSGDEVDCILNIVDATNLERGLCLTLELLAMGIPMVLALNMMDEVRACGGSVDTVRLSEQLGVPVVAISAVKGKGVPQLLHTALEVAHSRRMPRFYYEGDEGERLAFVRALCRQVVNLPEDTRQYSRSTLLDRLISGRWTGLPFFALIMGGVFRLTFRTVGPYLSGRLDALLDILTKLLALQLNRWGIAPILRELVLNGVCRGVASVLSFLPVILTLFFFLSLLEDSGYMARAAFLLDGLFRRLGLSGRCAVPLLMGFGCTVPGVMACRTLPGERTRRSTIRLIPFMSCTAKLPIYGLLAGAFFPERKTAVLAGLYLLGGMAGLFAALLQKPKEPPEPFLLELPNYRLPTLKNTFLLLGQKAGDFMRRAFTVIFLASLALWLLQGFDCKLHAVSNPGESMLAALAGWLSPVFRPLGLGDWRVITALLTGLLAKESVVSTLAVLFGNIGALQNTLSRSGAACLLVFTLLYTPCAAALAAVRRELGTGAALKMAAEQWLLAWAGAFLVGLIIRY